MTIPRSLVSASVALAATAAAATMALSAPIDRGDAAYPHGVGQAHRNVGPAARSGFREDNHWRFGGASEDRGFAHGVRGRGYENRRHLRSFGSRTWGYPYAGAGFADGYGAPDGPGAVGPEPYGEPLGYPPAARPMASALAPLAYGPGVHDGAYAYGYNGYAQTPALTAVYGPAGWANVGRPCGC
jgi:hypothetical protein